MTVAQNIPASASRSQNKAQLHNRGRTAVSGTDGQATVRRQGGADVADKHGVLTGSIVAQHLSRQDCRKPVVILHTALFNTKHGTFYTRRILLWLIWIPEQTAIYFHRVLTG